MAKLVQLANFMIEEDIPFEEIDQDELYFLVWIPFLYMDDFVSIVADTALLEPGGFRATILKEDICVNLLDFYDYDQIELLKLLYEASSKAYQGGI